jgi:Zn finger protein HypA/HybF involved in hydrogenase expression
VSPANDQPASTPGFERVAAARSKYHCPACGAEANWNPTKHALICAFCGTESPYELKERDEQTVITEHDLAEVLRSIPDSARGWHAEKTSVRCQSCDAVSVFDAHKVGQRCDFCGSAQLVPYEQVKDAFTPESLLPLKVDEPSARDLIRKWYRSRWFAPNKLRTKALTDTAKGIYLPYWTFDANVHAVWTAESGTYTGKDRKNIRWRPASGELSHFFDDDLVAASRGVNPAYLRGAEPFPTSTLIPYDPGYLAGWTVERYQIDLVNAAATSRRQMDAAIRGMCAKQIPGDTHRNLVVNSTYTNQRFKHILVPIWLLTYTFRNKTYQVIVNGVTGKISGGRPWSWIKISIVVLMALIIWYIAATN